MILILRTNHMPMAASVREKLTKLGLESQLIPGFKNNFLLVLSDTSTFASHIFSQIDGVEKVIRTKSTAPLATNTPAWPLALSPHLVIGSDKPIVIAGPCSVESRQQVLELASAVKSAGACALRGGAFKPRSSPYDFCGLGETALKYLAEARAQTGLPIVSEVMAPAQVELAEPFIDIYQVGARNMYNYDLLRTLGQSKKPVLLKRALSGTLQELLQSAEYIMLAGNTQVILCERGIRTFENHTRNTLDLAAVAALKNMTHLPVLVDPSHATGRRELIRPMSRAAIAAGADGLLIEVHHEPDKAMSDSAQAITPSELAQIVHDVDTIHNALHPAYSLDSRSEMIACLTTASVFSTSAI